LRTLILISISSANKKKIFFPGKSVIDKVIGNF
jgi:hypothetical protein